MLIVRGVNVFPTAIRQVVADFQPHVSGVILVRPKVRETRQSPPLPLTVELSDGAEATDDLADRIRQRLRDRLLVTTEVSLVEYGSLARTDYKSKLLDWSQAT
jgi:phenylacetate-CoA ligase